MSEREYYIYVLQFLWVFKAMDERRISSACKIFRQFANPGHINFHNFLLAFFGEENLQIVPYRPEIPEGYDDLNENDEEDYNKKWAISYYLDRPHYLIHAQIPALAELDDRLAIWQYESLLEPIINICAEVGSIEDDLEVPGEYFPETEFFKGVAWLRDAAGRIIGITFDFVELNPEDEYYFMESPPSFDHHFKAFIEFWDRLQKIRVLTRS